MDRDKVEECYKWDLSKIYGSMDELREDISTIKNKLEDFLQYEDVSYDSEILYNLISLYMEVSRMFSKIEVFSSLLCDEDTSINKNRELKEEVNNLRSEIIKCTYFIEPSILKLEYSDILKFYDENDKLKEYERYLYKLFRYKEHILSFEEERLLANLSKVFGNNYDSYELLKDSDMIFPSFYVDDKEYELDNNKFSLYISDNNRDIRKGAFNTLYDGYKQYKNIYTNLLVSMVKELVSTSMVRNYSSSMESSLFDDELTVDIYNNLVKVVHDGMNIVYKYYDLKKRVLGVDELHLYDVYVNLIADSSEVYEYDDAKEIVINALSIFGEEYVDILKKGIEDRWIDVYPNKGKRTGGYSSGSYDTFPYILLNYQNKYSDMSTLAHELGHSMHSYFTRENNPYQYGNYSIFVAEVASTVNELLLAKYVIKNSNDKKEKMFIINKLLELFRTTIYRQTMFSEFEKRVHELISLDLPVSADILCEEYYKLNELYFGDKVYIDDEIRYEWIKVPHFFYNFYVYKYATGLSSACYIVNGLMDGTIKREDYLEFLKCGDRLSPIESLKLTGVDLSKGEVVESALSMFEELIDEFNSLYFEK